MKIQPEIIRQAIQEIRKVDLCDSNLQGLTMDAPLPVHPGQTITHPEEIILRIPGQREHLHLHRHLQEVVTKTQTPLLLKPRVADDNL